MDAQRNPAQRIHLLLRAHVVGAPKIFDDNHIVRGRSCLSYNVFGADAGCSHPNIILCPVLSAEVEGDFVL
jgi:hypothetical protein